MTQRRGFALLSPERRKAISAAGGRAAHAAGTAHVFTSDEAREAGRLGGLAPHVTRGGPRRNVDQLTSTIVDHADDGVTYPDSEEE